MRKRVSRTAVFVFSIVTAFAQGTTSRVLGTVEDASGAVVPGAGVKLINEGTRVTFETKTSSAGAYFFEAVQPGDYELDVEAQGFRKFTTHNNTVTIGQPATINVKLDVGAIADVVTVEASAEAVQTGSSGNYGNLISGPVI